MRSLELKVPPAVVVVTCGAAMWGTSRLTPAASFEVPDLRIAALGLALAGVVLAIIAVCSFRANQTTVDPRTPGEASKLVVGGVYRWSRNPMYLGMLLLLAAWALFLANAAALFLLPAFVAYMTAFQIKPEERLLLSKFGEGYAQYKSAVRRWA
jgi:protein-S-isoprenylcysteine O-methyltransferase Ste14